MKPLYPTTHRQALRRRVLLFSLACMATLPALSQTTWMGTTNTDWGTASNWSAGVPDAADDVIIPDVTNDPLIAGGTAALARTVEVQSGGVLTVASSASLVVNGFKSYFFGGVTLNTALPNLGTVNNNGLLILGNTASVGTYGIGNLGTFNNNAGGEIQIDRSLTAGIYNVIGTFNNTGRIIIGANFSVGGFGIDNRSPFNNNTGGEIRIDRFTNTGLFQAGTFTNAASIIIVPSGSSRGLYNLASFTNSACASLSLSTSFYNTGSFTQQGLMTVNASAAHSNTGFVNDGTISYPQGNPIPNVTNNALIASPIAGCDAISPALSQGGSSPFIVGTTWYTDADLNNEAGTYDATTNTFTPIGLAGGQTYTLYFGVSSCPQVVPIQVTINAAPEATLGVSGPLDCNTPTVTLTAGGGVSYAFSGPGLSQSGPANTAPASQEGQYSVLVTGANGCTASATTPVSRTPDPGAPALSGVSLTVSTSTTPLSLTAFVTADDGNTLSFYNSASELLDPPTADISTPGQQTFSAVQTSPAGCPGPATFFTLTVESAATEPPLSQTVCRGSTVVLTVGVQGAASYQWFQTGQSANSRMSDMAGVQTGTATGSLTLLSVQGTSNYYCRVTMADGSVQWLGQYNVTVNKKCSTNSRLGVEEETLPLTVTLLSNPIEGGQLRAVVSGAAGQPLTVQVYSLQGRLLGQQGHERAREEQAVEWDLRAQPVGMYVLRAVSNGQVRQVKVLRQP
jgi:hypothetical protein